MTDHNDTAALVAFELWAKTSDSGWQMGKVVVNGKFSHFANPETDSAWIGFEAGFTAQTAEIERLTLLLDNASQNERNVQKVREHEYQRAEKAEAERDAALARVKVLEVAAQQAFAYASNARPSDYEFAILKVEGLLESALKGGEA